MAINGVGLKFYQNNAATMKNTKNVNSTEKFALEKTSGTQELERSRLSQSWNSERQMAENIMPGLTIGGMGVSE